MPTPVPLPENFLGEFHSVFLSDDVPYEDVERKLGELPHRKRRQALEFMSEALYDYEVGDYSEGKKDEWEKEKGIKEWKDKNTGLVSWFANVGKGMAETAADLSAGLLTGISAAGESVGEATGEGIEATGAYGGVLVMPEKSDATEEEVEERRQSTLRSWAKSLRDWESGHENRVTWEEVKDEPAASTLIPFVMEQGLISTPHMVAALTNLPGYIAARSGQLGHERALNKGLEDATIEEVVQALPAAAVSSMLERVGAQRVFGVIGKVKGKGAKEFGKSVGKAAATEAGTEAVQELIEYVGTHYKTNKKMSWTEAGDRMAQGGVVGFGFGGSVRMVTATGETVWEKQPDTEPEEAAATPAPDTGISPETAAQVEAAPEETAEAAPEEEPATFGLPEDERSVDSMQLQQEREQGTRPELDPGALSEGDMVTMDYGTGSAVSGRVKSSKDGKLSIETTAGATVTIDGNKPKDSDPELFTFMPGRTEGEQEAEAMLEDDVKAKELTRIINRAKGKEVDENTIANLKTALKDKDNMKRMTEEERNAADDLIAAHEKRKEAEKEAAKAEKKTPSKPTPKPAATPKEKPAEKKDTKTAPKQPEKPAEKKPEKPKEPEEPKPEPLKAVIPEGEKIEPTNEVITESGKRIPVRAEIVEAKDLFTSHDIEGTVNPQYPAELQPRDRSRKASQAQMRKMAGELVPELLQPSPLASEGAPIIGRDNAVESGNARTIAIRQAYEMGKADKYKQFLAEKGHDVSGFEQPVLVQRRADDMTQEDREAFAREANVRTTAARSAAEVASADAQTMNEGVVDSYVGGVVSQAANQEFVKKFIQTVVPASERGAMVTGEGRLSQEGTRRIENALFSKAYGDANLLGQLREDPSNDLYKGISNALMEMAGQWSKLRAAVEAGAIDKNMDTTQELLTAVRLIQTAREKNQAVSEVLSQVDAFADKPVSSTAERYLRMFFRNPETWTGPAGKDRIMTGMKNYVDMALASGKGEDMFGYKPEPDEMLDESLERAKEKKTASMFSIPKDHPEGDILAPYTPEELKARDKLEEERLTAEREAAKKAKLDAEVDNFVLTGSDSEADILAAMGQQSLFAVPRSDVYENALRTTLERIAPTAKLEIKDKIEMNMGGRRLQAEGQFILEKGRAIIQLSRNYNMLETLHHESIHALRNLGLFTKAEWSTLVKTAMTEGWIFKHQIPDRYPSYFKNGVPDERAYEEAIAEEFRSYMLNRKSVNNGIVRRLMDRMRDFFQRFLHAMRLSGHPNLNSEGIFRDVDAGVIGSRAHKHQTELKRLSVPRYSIEKDGFAFTDPEVEKRWQQAAQGVQKQSILATAKEAMVAEKNKMFRHWRELPKTPENADIVEKLVQLEQVPNAAKAKLDAFLSSFAKDASDQEISVMTRDMALKDILWTAEHISEDAARKFGFGGKEDIQVELERVEAVIRGNPKLREKLAAREKEVDKLKTGLVSSGVLTEAQVRNPHYFRNQVLEYAAMRGTVGGGGNKVKTPYWHGRKGSEKDINVNFFEAESEWMFKAGVDIQTARFLKWLKNSRHNRLPEMKRWAKDSNNSNMVDVFFAELDKANKEHGLNRKTIGNVRAFTDALKLKAKKNKDLLDLWKNRDQELPMLGQMIKFNQRVGMGISNFQKSLAELDQAQLNEMPEPIQKLIAEVKNDPMHDDTFKLYSWAANYEINPELQQSAVMIMAALNKRNQWVQTELIPDSYINTRSADDILKHYKKVSNENLELWQADSFDGKTRAVNMFTAKTIPEHVFDRVLDEINTEQGDADLAVALNALLSNARDIQAIAGPKQMMALDSSLVNILNNFNDKESAGMIDQVVRPITSKWKQWILFNPYRVTKYVMNNFTGDIDALIANTAGRKIFAKIPEAGQEIFNVMYKGGKASPVLEEAFDKGVIYSGLTSVEIDDATVSKLDNRNIVQITIGKGTNPVMNLGKKYFHTVRNAATFREATFRYAAYKHYREEFTKGRQLEDVGYGASRPEIVEALQDPLDKAAVMSRGALGDYADMSEMGRRLRRNLIPFWSWCVPMDTEILTREGWRFYDDIKVGDEVMTWNVDTDRTEWQPIKKLQKFDYDDVLDVHEFNYMKFRWTPDHRVPVILNGKTHYREYGKKVYRYEDKRKIVRAHELTSTHRIPLVAEHNHDGSEPILTPTEAELLGWIVTDGYSRWRGKHFEAVLYQSPKKNADYIRETFGGMLGKESVHPHTGVVCFRVNADATRRIKEVFKNKDDLPSIVTRLCPEGARRMYEAMIMAEATVRDDFTCFAQSPGPVMEAFQVLAYMNGVAGTIRRGKHWRGKDMDRMYLKRRRQIAPSKARRYKEHYTGQVWCPVTDNSTWVMRQNGTPMITGNTESNSVRYANFFRNAYLMGKAKGAKHGAIAGTAVAAALLAKIGIFYAGVQMFNNFFFPDEEGQMGPEDRLRLHLIVGTNDAGEIQTIRFQGAFSDFAGWLGMENAGMIMNEINEGRAELPDLMKQMAKAPVNKVVGGLNPVYKLPLELSGDKQFYPDVFSPRKIYDPWEHLARTFSLQNEYAVIAKRLGISVPTRGYAKGLQGAVMYSIDPGEIAYNKTRSLAYSYKEQSEDERSKLFYKYRKAVRLGDDKSAENALRELKELGVKSRSIRRSLDYGKPFSMLSRKERRELMKTMTPSEMEDMRVANQWWNEQKREQKRRKVAGE